MNVIQSFSLPLLTKELIEQSQNKRTYILRVVYAAILFGAALIQYQRIVGIGSANGLMNLGMGRSLLNQLWGVQVFMILMFMPPIACGAMTVEKEKDTLALLLLTKLSPWTIVFEKFLSRIFAIATYQLLSLPLFGIVYGLGGVELESLIVAVFSLFVLTLLIGAISILCSTWFRTTGVAFISTYIAVLTLYRIPSIYFLIQPAINLFYDPFGFWFSLSSLGFNHQLISYCRFPLILSLVCLLVSARVLVKRAFVPARNLILVMFQRADRFFSTLNEATTGGVILVPDQESLPQFEPISWRETRKKSLGTFRYQFRILMLLMTPLFVAIAAILTESNSSFGSPFRILPRFFWVIAVFCITLHATGSIPSERIRQTLDVILVAPISAAELIRQKLAGVRRLIMVLSVPFAVLVVFQAIWTGYIVGGGSQGQSFGFWMELVVTSLTAIVYMPVLMWTGFQLGLRCRTQIQAILIAFALIGAVCFFPALLWRYWLFLGPQIAVAGPIRGLISNWLFWLSPYHLIAHQSEFLNTTPSTYFGSIVNQNSPSLILTLIGIASHFFFYWLLGMWLRRNAEKSFSRIVRRLEATGGSVSDSPEA